MLMGVEEHCLPLAKDAWFVKPITGFNYCDKEDALPCYADGRVKVPHLPELPDHELQLQDH
jgi:hypothetical protein